MERVAVRLEPTTLSRRDRLRAPTWRLGTGARDRGGRDGARVRIRRLDLIRVEADADLLATTARSVCWSGWGSGARESCVNRGTSWPARCKTRSTSGCCARSGAAPLIPGDAAADRAARLPSRPSGGTADPCDGRRRRGPGAPDAPSLPVMATWAENGPVRSAGVTPGATRSVTDRTTARQPATPVIRRGTVAGEIAGARRRTSCNRARRRGDRAVGDHGGVRPQPQHPTRPAPRCGGRLPGRRGRVAPAARRPAGARARGAEAAATVPGRVRCALRRYALCLYLALGLADGGQQAIEVGTINYLWPAATVVLSIPILGKRARWTLVPGTLAVLAGIALATLPLDRWSARAVADTLRGAWLPYLLALVAALDWALYSNLSRRWAGGGGAGAVPLFMIVTAAVMAPLRHGVSRDRRPLVARARPRAGLLRPVPHRARILVLGSGDAAGEPPARRHPLVLHAGDVGGDRGALPAHRAGRRPVGWVCPSRSVGAWICPPLTVGPAASGAVDLGWPAARAEACRTIRPA